MVPKTLEVEFDGRVESFEFGDKQTHPSEVILAEITARFGTQEEIFFFVRETDREFDFTAEVFEEVLVAHRSRKILVEVNYEHLTKSHEFAPSATIFHVLQWSIGKHGYALDPMARSKANLIIPGAQAPLPREDVIAKYANDCTLKLDLTLRDFTNG